MSLSESVPVGGTPYTLIYNSSSVIGYKPRLQVRVDRTPSTALPPGVQVAGLNERLTIGGKVMRPAGWSYTLSGPRFHAFDGFTARDGVVEWDGRDASGRIAYGTHRGTWGVVTTLQLTIGGYTAVRDVVSGMAVASRVASRTPAMPRRSTTTSP